MTKQYLVFFSLTVLISQNITDTAMANQTGQNKKLLEALSGSENCWLNLETPDKNYLVSSISAPDLIVPDYNDLHISESQQVRSLNSKPSSKLETLFDHQISGLSALLLYLAFLPIGVITFLLLIKHLIVKKIITEIREHISELRELEIKLSTASQQAESLSHDFQAKIEKLSHESQQNFDNLKNQANQKGFAVQQLDSIKSHWMSELENMVLEVYDARDQALEKISKIGAENIGEKVDDIPQNKTDKKLFQDNSNYLDNSVQTTERAKDRDYICQGIELLQEGYYSDALIAYNQAIALNYNDAEAWYQRGNALGCLQQYQQALASYQRALDLQPERADIWVNRGHVLMRLQQYKQAIASYKNAIKLQQDRAEYWQNQENLLAKLQRYQ